MLLLRICLFCILTVSSQAGLESCGWRCGSDCLVESFICDGYEQCEDNSDETEGCHLFPESGCKSHGGRRHYLCQRTGDCFQTRAGAEACERSVTTVKPSNGCMLDDGDQGWKCGDGKCIVMDQV